MKLKTEFRIQYVIDKRNGEKIETPKIRIQEDAMIVQQKLNEIKQLDNVFNLEVYKRQDRTFYRNFENGLRGKAWKYQIRYFHEKKNGKEEVTLPWTEDKKEIRNKLKEIQKMSQIFLLRLVVRDEHWVNRDFGLRH